MLQETCQQRRAYRHTHAHKCIRRTYARRRLLEWLRVSRILHAVAFRPPRPLCNNSCNRAAHRGLAFHASFVPCGAHVCVFVASGANARHWRCGDEYLNLVVCSHDEAIVRRPNHAIFDMLRSMVSHAPDVGAVFDERVI